MDYKTLCVVNPAAGNKRGIQRWKQYADLLAAAGIEIDEQYTSRPGEASYITRDALKQGYNRILAAGGDGTLNEVINGFWDEEGVINPEACLGIVPIGTGGDFARLFDFSDKQGIIALLQNNRVQACDIVRATFTGWGGRRESRYFINVSDSGIGSETVARVNRNSKALGGFWSFLLACLTSIATYKNRNLVVTVDGTEVFNGPSCLIVVSNGQYFGGGVRIAPQASLHDGFLDVVIAKDFSKLELFGLLPKAYRGNHLNHAKVGFHRAQQVTVKSTEVIYLEVDGESVGQGDFEIEIIPAALQLVV